MKSSMVKKSPNAAAKHEMITGPIRKEDIIKKFYDVAKQFGLVVDPLDLDMSGKLTRCGTTKKPNGTDGAYIIHADWPPSIWGCNYQEGGEGRTIRCYEENGLKKLTSTELYALQETIRQAKAERQKKLQDTQQKAANDAAKSFEILDPALPVTPYLKKKGVAPCGDMRYTNSLTTPFGKILAEGECLCLPVLNTEGQIRSLQYIDRNGQKRFHPHGETRGCFFPIPAKDGSRDGPLLIGEGAATVASLCQATGYAGLAAFFCGNLEEVACAARSKYPDREIVICADNDCTNSDGTPRPENKNAGIKCAKKAAEASGGKLAICPAIDGRKADFNDLFTHDESGPAKVKEIIETARKDRKLFALPPPFFYNEKDGALYRTRKDRKDNPLPPEKICDHIEALARTDGASECGILFKFQGLRGNDVQMAIPSRLFQQQGTLWAEMLADKGFDICQGQQKAFKECMSGLPKDLPIIHNVSKIGWDSGCYVLPDQTLGTGGENVVLQQAGYDFLRGLYQRKGTLKDWQELAALCAGNTRLEFVMSAAFAGPLLALAHLGGATFNLEGGTSVGKSTALKMSASVWGNPETQGRSWSTTDNGMEAACSLFNDNVMYVDELGVVDGKSLSRIIYTQSNGTGKTRANRSGGFKMPSSWRCLCLSSGEVGAADKLEEDGQNVRAGQLVRFIGIQVDLSHISNLHGFENSAALIEKITELAPLNYGHAGRQFLHKLTADPEKFRMLTEQIPGRVEELARALCPAGTAPQVQRVAKHFALVQLAGEMAQEFQVMPGEINTAAAVASCFADWLKDRGTTGSTEDQEAKKAVRLFIERFGDSRFTLAGKENIPCNERAGYKTITDDGGTYYCFLPEVLKAIVLKGHAFKRALNCFKKDGILLPDNDGRHLGRRIDTPDGKKRTFWISFPEES